MLDKCPFMKEGKRCTLRVRNIPHCTKLSRCPYNNHKRCPYYKDWETNRKSKKIQQEVP